MSQNDVAFMAAAIRNAEFEVEKSEKIFANEFSYKFAMWVSHIPTGPYSGGFLDDLDEAIERLTKEREEMRVKFGVAA